MVAKQAIVGDRLRIVLFGRFFPSFSFVSSSRRGLRRERGSRETNTATVIPYSRRLALSFFHILL